MKYLKSIEAAGLILIVIGIIVAYTAGYNYGAWPCGCGMAALLVTYVYKAFHWKQFERENRRNILIILIAIVIIYLKILMHL